MRTAKGNLSELSNAVGEIDLYLCHASFEDRCLSISRSIEPSQIKSTIVYENEAHRDLYGTRASWLLERFSRDSKTVLTSASDPLLTADRMLEALEKSNIQSCKSLLVDITTFTHESLLILLRIMRRYTASARILLAYNVAGDYSTNEPPGRKWLSRGIAEIRSVLGFAGLHLPSRKLHLIVLVGLERDRTVGLITAYEPSVISLGYGEPPLISSEGAVSSSDEVYNEVRSLFGSALRFSFASHDPNSTMEAVKNQIQIHRSLNTIIAPMNTKVSTLGVAQAAIEDESVQICYARAILYNNNFYSVPSDTYILCEWP